MNDQPQPQSETIVYRDAVANAVRLLRFAEDEMSNERRMSALTELGHAWIDLASLVLEREP